MNASVHFKQKLLVALSCTLMSSTVAQADGQFNSCIAQLKNEAIKAGVSSNQYTKLTQNLKADLSILEKLDYQPEFKTPIWDYMAALVDPQRIEEGKRLLKKHEATLQRAENVYGVPPEVIVAVWGVESNYGQNFGSYDLREALGTLSCYGRRQSFFKKQFFSALRIIQAGHISAEQLKGSWAGAFGHTQFMPTTFEQLAVDFDGDGKKDLINNSVDAIGSTANYLAKNGWQKGKKWGFEVKLPKNYQAQSQGRKNKHSINYWEQQGLKNIYGQSLKTQAAGQDQAGLFLPAGKEGPAFLVFKNFDVIYSYNAAESYALAIAHLSDRLQGARAFVTPWPTDDLGLSREQNKELQKILLSRGHDIGEVDGLIGSKTREAIKQEEQNLNLPVKGRAGQKILNALKQQQ